MISVSSWSRAWSVGHVRRCVGRFGVRRHVTVTGPVKGRRSDFGDQVSDTETATGVGARPLSRVILLLEPFPRRGAPHPRRGRSTIRVGCAPTAKSGVVLAVTHVLPASKIQLHPSYGRQRYPSARIYRRWLFNAAPPAGSPASAAVAQRPNRSATEVQWHKAHIVLELSARTRFCGPWLSRPSA